MTGFLSPGSRARRRQLAEQSPIVLMGRGHSGTRVLSRICSLLGVRMGTAEDSPAGDVEHSRLQREIKYIALHSLGLTRTEELPPRLLRRFQSAVYAYFSSLGRPTGDWGWKFPETYLIGPYVAATFPRARIVHLVRDGRDIAFKRHLTDDPRRKLGRAILERQGVLDQPQHIRAAASWAYQVDRFDEFRSTTPELAVLDIVFRQLCQAPVPATQQLCEFLGLPMTPPLREYLDQEVDAGKVGEHRASDPALLHDVEARVGPTLRRYGFMV